jgi:hypothetical protein
MGLYVNFTFHVLLGQTSDWNDLVSGKRIFNILETTKHFYIHHKYVRISSVPYFQLHLVLPVFFILAILLCVKTSQYDVNVHFPDN